MSKMLSIWFLSQQNNLCKYANYLFPIQVALSIIARGTNPMQMNVMNANMAIISAEKSAKVWRLFFFPYRRHYWKLRGIQTRCKWMCWMQFKWLLSQQNNLCKYANYLFPIQVVLSIIARGTNPMQMNVMNANMVIISTERSVQVCRVLLFPFRKQD